MADEYKVKFKINVIPIERLERQVGSKYTSIAASECYGTFSGGGEIDGLTIIGETGDSNDGYSNGSQYYKEALKVAEDSVIPGTHGFANLASCDILAIKHTGFKYAQTDTLGEKNTTDYLSIMVNAGAGTDICIGRLKAGEAIMLPTRGGLATNNIMVSSTNGSGSAGANTIAVEFLAIT